MVKLEKVLVRETTLRHRDKPVIIELHPDKIRFRLKGKRMSAVLLLSDVFKSARMG